MTDNQPAPAPRKIDAAEVLAAIAQSPYRRATPDTQPAEFALWQATVPTLDGALDFLVNASRANVVLRAKVQAVEDGINSIWRDLTACRSELASLALQLQDRDLLPEPGGDNYALVVGAALTHIISLELAVIALNEDRKELPFLRAEETDDLRTTLAMLWDLMTDDQCIRFSCISPVRYEAVQDLWRKWADRQGER